MSVAWIIITFTFLDIQFLSIIWILAFALTCHWWVCSFLSSCLWFVPPSSSPIQGLSPAELCLQSPSRTSYPDSGAHHSGLLPPPPQLQRKPARRSLFVLSLFTPLYSVHSTYTLWNHKYFHLFLIYFVSSLEGTKEFHLFHSVAPTLKGTT